MENNTHNEDLLDHTPKLDAPWPIAMRYALIAVGFAVTMVFLQFLGGLMDMAPMMEEGASTTGRTIITYVLMFLSMAVYMYLYFLAVKDYRTQLGGFISFGQGFKVSFFSVLIKLLFLSLFVFMFYSFINPGFHEEMLDFLRFTMEKQGAPDEAIETSVSWMGGMYSPLGMTFLTGFMTLIGGSILSLIAAAIGQKHRM